MNKPRWAQYHKERWDRLVLHHNFLKKVEVEKKCSLWCEYCGKQNLVIYSWDMKPNRLDMATVDHFLPKSKYPDLANDETNFIVSCSACNESKKDDIWEESKILYSRNKVKVI